MNILGWEHWTVTKGEQKGPDYRFEAEYQLRPERCPNCPAESPQFENRGIKTVKVRDERIHGKRVGIEVRKRQWRCSECGKSFVERPPEIDPKRRMTTRLVETLRRRSFERTFSELADEYGVSEATVRDIFNDALVEREAAREIEPPEILGIDEVHLQAKRFVAANLGSSPSALVDILHDRNQATVERFLDRPEWVESVKVVAMDMWQPYRNAVVKQLPDAVIVVDKFHVLQMSNRILDRVRDGIVRFGTGRERKALKGSRPILRRRRGALTGEQLERLDEWRTAFPDLMTAYELKESLHEIYAAEDRQEGNERMDAWIRSVPRELEVAFREQINALQRWKTEVLNYFDTGVTNAGTEALNGLIRLTNQLGNGYGFTALRAKMLYGAPQVQGAYWSSQEAAKPIPGSLGFSLGVHGGASSRAGADIEWLVARMAARDGDWADPRLWGEA